MGKRGYAPTPAIGRLLGRTRVEGDCVVWAGARLPSGYGRIYSNGKAEYTHRVVWEHYHGPIPDGVVVRHICDNPPCILIDHLVAGSQRENLQDMYERGRSIRSPLKESCLNGHRYDEDNLYVDAKGQRSCLICRRAAGAASRKRRKEKRDGGSTRSNS